MPGWLWFGDERGYNATEDVVSTSELSCGLVMKEDITQHQLAQTFVQEVVVW